MRSSMAGSESGWTLNVGRIMPSSTPMPSSQIIYKPLRTHSQPVQAYYPPSLPSSPSPFFHHPILDITMRSYAFITFFVLLAFMATLAQSSPLFFKPGFTSNSPASAGLVAEKRQLKQFNPRLQLVNRDSPDGKHQPSKRAEAGGPKPSKRAVSAPV